LVNYLRQYAIPAIGIGLLFFLLQAHADTSNDANNRSISCKQITPLCESANFPKESAVYQTCCVQTKSSAEFIKLQNDHLKLMSKFLAVTADNDNDGVVNLSDKCPNTPANIAVDFKGCTIDTDQDTIPDIKAQCLANPNSTSLSANGCIPDSDGDGINDNKDQCPNSTKNTPINETGCMVDFDKDGIGDLNDQCIDTHLGAIINSQGCELDSDKDGIVDSEDFCNDNAEKTTVNAIGCKKDEKQRLKGIEFKISSNTLLTKSSIQLDKMSKILRYHPKVKIEIGGHTDSSGNNEPNLALSHQRAVAVKNYLVSKGLNADYITATGYGESQPIADNKTEQGRSKNRRVELTVLP
jgi:outer membrane protein OmpA-like peptidoglycan-associated protein